MAVPAVTPTLFGAYIQSISTSIGWGGQGGACQMTLVEDPDNGIVIPKFKDGVRDDVRGDPFTGDSLTSPQTGTAAGIRYGDFYFGGIFQRYSYQESLSGRVYNVVLESPAKLLDGIQVILDEFQGTIFAPVNAFYGDGTGSGGSEPSQFTYGDPYVTNVWNVLGELENFSYNAQTGAIFGKADVNSVGIPVLTLLDVLQKFGQDDPNIFFGGPAKFGQSTYKFDFTELIEVVTEKAPYYRVSGPVQNLNGILADICETIQYQYFPQVIGPSGLDTDGIANPTIKIRVLDLGQQPSPGIIKDLVNSTKEEGKLISSSVGEELQTATTQKVVIGGDASRYYNAPVSTFLSVFGKNSNMSYYVAGPATTVYTGVNSAGVDNVISLPYPDQFATTTYTATIFELRMALGGMECWETYKAFQTMLEDEGGYTEPNRGSLYSGYPPWFSRLYATKAILQSIADGTGVPTDLSNTDLNQAQQAYLESQKQLSQKMFNVVNKAASEFFGQVFFCPLPYEKGGFGNNLRWISEESQYEASWDIVDSAWYFNKDTGADERPIQDVIAYDGEGRLRSHSVFLNDGISDFSSLGSDYAQGFGGFVCTPKGGPDKDIFWVNAGFGLAPYALVRTGAQVRSYDSYTTPDFGLTVLAQLFFGIDIPPQNYIGPEKEDVQIPIPPGVTLPISIGVPQQSNRYKWGPWYSATRRTGRAEVVLDDSLRPETFGSSETLDQAGLATAFSGVGAMQAIESGFVEIAEFPSFNVGDRWAEQGPYVTNLDISVGVDGCKCTYKFNTWTPDFGKLAKYNIDRISRINKSSLAAAQRERGKLQRRPFPAFTFKQSDFSNAYGNGGDRFTQRGTQVIRGLMDYIANQGDG